MRFLFACFVVVMPVSVQSGAHKSLTSASTALKHFHRFHGGYQLQHVHVDIHHASASFTVFTKPQYLDSFFHLEVSIVIYTLDSLTAEASQEMDFFPVPSSLSHLCYPKYSPNLFKVLDLNILALKLLDTFLLRSPFVIIRVLPNVNIGDVLCIHFVGDHSIPFYSKSNIFCDFLGAVNHIIGFRHSIAIKWSTHLHGVHFKAYVYIYIYYIYIYIISIIYYIYILYLYIYYIYIYILYLYIIYIIYIYLSIYLSNL